MSAQASKPGSPKAGSPNASKRPSKSEVKTESKDKKSSTAGSPVKSPSPKPSKPLIDDDPDGTKPVFIYGGPFIKIVKPSMFLDTMTPINLPLSGIFRRSYAYTSLKDRSPTILTKVIDYCSREAQNIKAKEGATDEDLQSFIRYVSKLKSDLVTNKPYEKFVAPNPELAKWNNWMESCDPKNYFGNSWGWTECYIYRRLKEGCELTNGLKNFDYFQEVKQQGFRDNLEAMCVVAEKVNNEMISKSERAKKKEDFMTLLKICMWSNKCDMSFTMGEGASFSHRPPPPPPNLPPPPPPKGKKPKPPPPPPPDPPYIDPFVMISNNKEYLLIDDSGKAFENLTKKSEAIATKIANAQSAPFKAKCSCHRLATLAGWAKKEPEPDQAPPPLAEGEERPKVPCPAKMVLPQAIIFDIVCDNAGYELFTDLCFAHFLIAQEMVQKIRFHVKKYPWYVSDTTIEDFKYVINMCKNASYMREVTFPPNAEGEAPPPRTITAEPLQALGRQWAQYLEDGTFQLMAEDYWTYPHTYKDMKQIDPNLYRKFQFSVMTLFKGDLNYRKLLGDRNAVDTNNLEQSMQGFIPCPIIAARTVKSETICGLPKAKAKKGVMQPSKAQQLLALDPEWMIKGYYGVIQVCPKAEPFKPATTPCIDYGTTCFGVICPTHDDI